MANYQFPMEGMMGPSTPIDRITAGSSMFGTGAPTAGERVLAEEARGKYFQELLNKLKSGGAAATTAVGNSAGPLVAGLGSVGKYGLAAAPGVANIAGGISGQDLGQTLTGAAQVAAGAGATRAAAPIGSAVTRGAAAMLPGPAKLAAPLIGGATQAALGAGAANLTGLIASLPGKAAEVITGQSQREREAGKTPGILPGSGTGVGLDATTQKELAILRELQKYGIEGTVAGAQAMLPIQNQYLDAQMQRQMQLNQQTGQLTGALNRQQYAFQLAQGAQSEAGANLRTMISSNPYASSAFRY